MRRGDKSNVSANRTAASQTLELLLLNYSKELRLEFERNIANLVQEKRPPMCEFKSPRTLRYCAGERAPLMPKQFAFEQPGRNSRAVHFYEWALRAPAGLMDSGRDQLFADASLTKDHHSRICWRYNPDLIHHIGDCSASAYHPAGDCRQGHPAPRK
jgi:hypothetical protein